MSKTITNQHDLPEVFLEACKVDRHRVLGDISVTQLIDSPQIRLLKKKHNDELEQDVSEMIWMLFGTAVHKVLEMADINNKEAQTLRDAAEVLEWKGYEKGKKFIDKVLAKDFPNAINEDVMLEQTITLDILGWTLSGTADRIIKSEKKIQDYKTATVYSYMNPESQLKWEEQLNVYAYMFAQIGIEIDSLEVVAIFKDWSRMKILSDSRYPKAPVARIELNRWTNEEVEKFIKNRIRLHQASEKEQVIECSPKERWSAPDLYKIMKKGGKRSLKNFEDRQEAERYLKTLDGKYPKAQAPFIEEVKGGSRRCEDFCPVAQFCQQRKKELEELNSK